MMVIRILFIISLIGVHTSLVFAQLEEVSSTPLPLSLKAVIASVSSVETGRSIILSAQDSVINTSLGEIRYFWDLGDGEKSYREEVVHMYQTPGLFNVRLQIQAIDPNGKIIASSEMTKEVFVYHRALVLFADSSGKQDRLRALISNAEEENVYLQLIDTQDGGGTNDVFSSLLEEHLDLIRDADVLLLWSERIDVLSILNQLRGRVSFLNKDIVVVSDGSLSVVRNVMSGVFSLLQPHRIILTRRESIDEFFTTRKDSDVLQVLLSRGYDFEVLTEESVGKISFFNLPSLGIQFLQQQGVSETVVLYLLLLGVIVTLVAFLKLVVGLSSVGLRIPVVLTYLFLVVGVEIGLLFLFLTFGCIWLLKYLIGKKHLLYTAKVAIVISFLGVLLLFFVGLLLYFQIVLFDLASVLIILCASVLMERMVGIESEHGAGATIRILSETLFIAFLTYLFVSWPFFQILLMAHPELLLVFILANFLMGRFTGLRIMEYFRFREVLRYSEEE